VATAASTAFPPAHKICSPAVTALAELAVTAPFLIIIASQSAASQTLQGT
jgi:hypothetical protein